MCPINVNYFPFDQPRSSLERALDKIDEQMEASQLPALLRQFEEKMDALAGPVVLRQLEEQIQKMQEQLDVSGLSDSMNELHEQLELLSGSRKLHEQLAALRRPEILEFEVPRFVGDDFRLPEIEPLEERVRRVVREEVREALAEIVESTPPADDDRLYGADGVKRTPGFKVDDDDED